MLSSAYKSLQTARERADLLFKLKSVLSDAADIEHDVEKDREAELKRVTNEIYSESDGDEEDDEERNDDEANEDQNRLQPSSSLGLEVSLLGGESMVLDGPPPPIMGRDSETSMDEGGGAAPHSSVPSFRIENKKNTAVERTKSVAIFDVPSAPNSKDEVNERHLFAEFLRSVRQRPVKKLRHVHQQQQLHLSSSSSSVATPQDSSARTMLTSGPSSLLDGSTAIEVLTIDPLDQFISRFLANPPSSQTSVVAGHAYTRDPRNLILQMAAQQQHAPPSPLTTAAAAAAQHQNITQDHSSSSSTERPARKTSPLQSSQMVAVGPQHAPLVLVKETNSSPSISNGLNGIRSANQNLLSHDATLNEPTRSSSGREHQHQQQQAQRTMVHRKKKERDILGGASSSSSSLQSLVKEAGKDPITICSSVLPEETLEQTATKLFGEISYALQGHGTRKALDGSDGSRMMKDRKGRLKSITGDAVIRRKVLWCPQCALWRVEEKKTRRETNVPPISSSVSDEQLNEDALNQSSQKMESITHRAPLKSSSGAPQEEESQSKGEGHPCRTNPTTIHTERNVHALLDHIQLEEGGVTMHHHGRLSVASPTQAAAAAQRRQSLFLKRAAVTGNDQSSETTMMSAEELLQILLSFELENLFGPAPLTQQDLFRHFVAVLTKMKAQSTYDKWLWKISKSTTNKSSKDALLHKAAKLENDFLQPLQFRFRRPLPLERQPRIHARSPFAAQSTERLASVLASLAVERRCISFDPQQIRNSLRSKDRKERQENNSYEQQDIDEQTLWILHCEKGLRTILEASLRVNKSLLLPSSISSSCVDVGGSHDRDLTIQSHLLHRLNPSNPNSGRMLHRDFTLLSEIAQSPLPVPPLLFPSSLLHVPYSGVVKSKLLINKMFVLPQTDNQTSTLNRRASAVLNSIFVSSQRRHSDLSRTASMKIEQIEQSVGEQMWALVGQMLIDKLHQRLQREAAILERYHHHLRPQGKNDHGYPQQRDEITGNGGGPPSQSPAQPPPPDSGAMDGTPAMVPSSVAARRTAVTIGSAHDTDLFQEEASSTSFSPTTTTAVHIGEAAALVPPLIVLSDHEHADLLAMEAKEDEYYLNFFRSFFYTSLMGPLFSPLHGDSSGCSVDGSSPKGSSLSPASPVTPRDEGRLTAEIIERVHLERQRELMRHEAVLLKWKKKIQLVEQEQKSLIALEVAAYRRLEELMALTNSGLPTTSRLFQAPDADALRRMKSSAQEVGYGQVAADNQAAFSGTSLIHDILEMEEKLQEGTKLFDELRKRLNRHRGGGGGGDSNADGEHHRPTPLSPINCAIQLATIRNQLSLVLREAKNTAERTVQASSSIAHAAEVELNNVPKRSVMTHHQVPSALSPLALNILEEQRALYHQQELTLDALQKEFESTPFFATVPHSTTEEAQLLSDLNSGNPGGNAPTSTSVTAPLAAHVKENSVEWVSNVSQHFQLPSFFQEAFPKDVLHVTPQGGQNSVSTLLQSVLHATRALTDNNPPTTTEKENNNKKVDVPPSVPAGNDDSRPATNQEKDSIGLVLDAYFGELCPACHLRKSSSLFCTMSGLPHDIVTPVSEPLGGGGLSNKDHTNNTKDLPASDDGSQPPSHVLLRRNSSLSHRRLSSLKVFRDRIESLSESPLTLLKSDAIASSKPPAAEGPEEEKGTVENGEGENTSPPPPPVLQRRASLLEAQGMQLQTLLRSQLRHRSSVSNEREPEAERLIQRLMDVSKNSAVTMNFSSPIGSDLGMMGITEVPPGLDQKRKEENAEAEPEDDEDDGEEDSQSDEDNEPNSSQQDEQQQQQHPSRRRLTGTEPNNKRGFAGMHASQRKRQRLVVLPGGNGEDGEEDNLRGAPEGHEGTSTSTTGDEHDPTQPHQSKSTKKQRNKRPLGQRLSSSVVHERNRDDGEHNTNNRRKPTSFTLKSVVGRNMAVGGAPDVVEKLERETFVGLSSDWGLSGNSRDTRTRSVFASSGGDGDGDSTAVPPSSPRRMSSNLERRRSSSDCTVDTSYGDAICGPLIDAYIALLKDLMLRPSQLVKRFNEKKKKLMGKKAHVRLNSIATKHAAPIVMKLLHKSKFRLLNMWENDLEVTSDIIPRNDFWTSVDRKLNELIEMLNSRAELLAPVLATAISSAQPTTPTSSEAKGSTTVDGEGSTTESPMMSNSPKGTNTSSSSSSSTSFARSRQVMLLILEHQELLRDVGLMTRMVNLAAEDFAATLKRIHQCEKQNEDVEKWLAARTAGAQ